MIKIYNSLTNKLEDFIPIKENEVSMYVCGPTVYNNLHIGNSRPVIFFDTVARFFKYLGYKVTYVSNFTDIDDKIIKKALEEGVTEKEISTRYIKIIRNLYHRLNCLPHDANPLVTENMDGIIDFINKMVENGGAYAIDGDVYFDVAKIKEYGILSGQTVENLLNGVRIENNDKKHNPIDFTLWKTTDVGVRWPSPWGPEGRPGWHTECVVMIDNIFKGKIDIHGGGSDLKFPHHDNEIAQSICVNNHMIANYWIHNGRVDLAGEKMSKSLGNIIWAEDLLDEIGTPVYRLMMLNVPYRQLLNYKEDLVSGARADFEKIRRAYVSSYRKLELLDTNNLDLDYYKDFNNEEIKNLIDEFINAMSNDFNTANGITTIFKLTKLINNELRSKELNKDLLFEEYSALKSMLWVLGIQIDLNKLSEDDKKLIKDWQDAKANKDFEKADALRNEINNRNIEL